MELGLEGKVAIITGGSKGIGRAAALGLVREGGCAVICARGKEALDETVAAAGSRGRERVVAIEADLTDASAPARIFDRAVAEFGKVDILVNNAGSARPGDFQKISDDDWKLDFELKFFGYVRMAREAMRRMGENKNAVVVNVIGTGALRPSAGYMVGGAANAALNHFTKALAEEGAKSGVRVVGINPGPILTERLQLFLNQQAQRSKQDPEQIMRRMTPLGRPGKADEVADLILFLASDRAAFIHGANITIDGGANPGLMG
jgi:NAD(P)-dependent dehydrogenase (short-subunit alcohol dehydrogenase family)